MAGLVGSGAGLLDPACGFGGTLLAAARRDSRARIHGVDINAEASNFTRRRLRLAGFRPEIETFDFLDEEPQPTWDSIVAEPPMGTRVSTESTGSQQPFSNGRKTRFISDIRDGDALWLASVADSLAPRGRGVLLAPQSLGYRAGVSDEVRGYFLETGRVEAIIAMPPGAVHASSAATCIWVIGGEARERGASDVLMVNAHALASRPGDFSSILSPVLDTARRWLQEGSFGTEGDWFARPVPVHELLKAHNATPQRHLAIPPERIAPRPTAPGRHLTEIRLQSFKSVKNQVEVPLKPLTLIYGRNSAGKSSLIQSILLMKQSAATGRLVPNGALTSLGTISGLAHNHVTDVPIEMGLSFASAPELDSSLTLPNPSDARSIDLRFDATDIDAGSLSTVTVGLGDLRFDWHRHEENPAVAVAEMDDLVHMVRHVYSQESVHPPRKKSTSDQPAFTRREFRQLGRQSADFDLSNFIPSRPTAAILNEARHVLIGASREGRLEGILRSVGTLFGAVGEELRSLLDRVAYLGPLRQAPERISVRAADSRALDLPYFLLDNISERQEVSERLQRLGVPYDLDVVSLSDPAERSLFGEIAALVLTDTRTGTRLSPADVGFGISQVLPIVAELSARTNSVILIEQPEIHLHPAMQADLADLLIESIEESGRANQVIAETHSESLMLRVQRRIREGSLSPDDVAVLYVDQDPEGAAIVQRLRLDAEGDFIDSWPHGFFAERFEETFSGLL